MSVDSSSSDSTFKTQTLISNISKPKSKRGFQSKGGRNVKKKVVSKGLNRSELLEEKSLTSIDVDVKPQGESSNGNKSNKKKQKEVQQEQEVEEEEASRHASSSLSDQQSSRSSSLSQSPTPPHFSIFNVEPLTTSRRSLVPKIPPPIAIASTSASTSNSNSKKRRFLVQSDVEETKPKSKEKEKEKDTKPISSSSSSRKVAAVIAVSIVDSGVVSDSSSGLIGGIGENDLSSISDSDEEVSSSQVSKSVGTSRGRSRFRGGVSRGKSRGRTSVGLSVASNSASNSPVPSKRSTTTTIGNGNGNGNISAASDSNNSPVIGRATRATVTLPKGYIEGVKNTRMIKARSESLPLTSSEEEEESKEEEESPPEVIAVVIEVPMLPEEPEKEEEEAEEEEVELLVKAKKSIKGKEKAKDKSKEKGKEKEVIKEVEIEEYEMEVVQVVAVLEEEIEKPTEQEREDALEPEAERIGHSKRQKLDLEAQERAAEIALERTIARDLLLEQLDQEEFLVKSSTHPLIELTYNRLLEEKALRLTQLAAFRQQHELEIDRRLDADTEATWRRWADERDTLRTDLYLANHNQLKQLIYEEKAYPFLRDHPLLINTHSLPPVPFYRAPLLHSSNPDLQPRNTIYSGHYLDPPAHNRALDHTVWELSTTEIEEDLAIFADVDDVQYVSQPFSASHSHAVAPLSSSQHQHQHLSKNYQSQSSHLNSNSHFQQQQQQQHLPSQQHSQSSQHQSNQHPSSNIGQHFHQHQSQQLQQQQQQPRHSHQHQQLAPSYAYTNTISGSPFDRSPISTPLQSHSQQQPSSITNSSSLNYRPTIMKESNNNSNSTSSGATSSSNFNYPSWNQPTKRFL